MPHIPGFLARLHPLCLSAVVLALAACGGAQDTEKSVEAPSFPSSSPSRLPEGDSAPGPASARDVEQLAQGAQLSRADLQAAELQAQTLDQAPVEKTGLTDPLASLLPGQIAPKTAYLSGGVARKAAAVRIPAYRFYNGSTGAHFYTTSETERANVAATLSPPYSFEGPAFSVANDFSPGLSPVHRFFNSQSGVHFYTISETERANVEANLPQFTYEGVAYYASSVAGVGLVPLYRFYVPSRGFHFYTASLAERDNIIATLSATYSYENIGYYVLASNWSAEKLPHTGVTASQCYQVESNTLVPCSYASATNLNSQQDGHRATVNPLSYSGVFAYNLGSTQVNYANTSCVRDNVTGLVWEGKTAGGDRPGSYMYTNLGNGSGTDTSGHVAAVNASALCGFTDWRLPSRQELLTLVDYGKTTGAPINTTWFPNTALARYWSAEVLSTNSAQAWFVSGEVGGGRSDFAARNNANAVRLVRGGAASGPRFSFTTAAYSAGGQTDAANNLVNDAWTGLQWRRCDEGRIWNGNACAGSPSSLTHEEALIRASQQPGWRLPNVKELASLVDLSVSGGPRTSLVAFPGMANVALWSSSPSVGAAGDAWGVDFYEGQVLNAGRYAATPVRLVRTSP